MNEALVQDARNGDARAFAKLVEAYYRPIYGVAFSTVGNWQAAEDVAQDAFLVAWLNIAKLRTVEAFGVWLRRIARNLAFNWIRSERYRRALMERRDVFDQDEAAPEAVGSLARADSLAQTWAALEKLSPPLREAVVLFYLEENSIAQTAHVLGIAENAVKKRLQHARPQLRRYFEDQWKAEMERERQRINAQQAGRRFTAGVALGPVSTLAGKLGKGAGLWELLRDTLGFDSFVVKTGAAALVLVATSGAGLFWNAHRQEPVSESAPHLSGPSNSTSNAAPVGTVKAVSAVKIEEENASAVNPVRGHEAAVASSAEQEIPVQRVTVAGHVVDEAQHPVQGATVTVVASGIAMPAISEPTVGFGGSGGVGRASASEGGVSFGAGSSEGGGAVGGRVEGSMFVNKEGGLTFAIGSLHEDALVNALLDKARRFSAKSASDGSFSITDVPGDGLLIVSADASGYCLQGSTLTLSSGAPVSDLTISLSPGFSVEGHVFGAEGRPVADALLQVTALAWNRESSAGGWGRSPQDWGWTRTDVQGHFSLKVGDSGYATIAVRSKEQGRATFQAIGVSPGAVADLRFPKQSAVRGKITRFNGAPASGITIQLTGHAAMNLEDPKHGVQSGGEMSESTCEAATDAEGGYQITGVDPQIRHIACLLDEDKTPLATGIELEPLKAGQTLLWNYTLPRPIVVKGVVIEKGSARPAAGALVLCTAVSEVPENDAPLDVMSAAHVVTDLDGVYEMRITTPPGEYAFGIQTLMGFRTLARRELRQGETAVVDLAVPGTWSRNFVVVDSSGNPLSGVGVVLQGEGSDWRFGIPEKTNDNGRVRVDHLPSGERLKCIFNYESHEAESEILEGQEGMEYPEETVVIDLSK